MSWFHLCLRVTGSKWTGVNDFASKPWLMFFVSCSYIKRCVCFSLKDKVDISCNYFREICQNQSKSSRSSVTKGYIISAFVEHSERSRTVCLYGWVSNQVLEKPWGSMVAYQGFLNKISNDEQTSLKDSCREE